MQISCIDQKTIFLDTAILVATLEDHMIMFFLLLSQQFVLVLHERKKYLVTVINNDIYKRIIDFKAEMK